MPVEEVSLLGSCPVRFRHCGLAPCHPLSNHTVERVCADIKLLIGLQSALWKTAADAYQESLLKLCLAGSRKVALVDGPPEMLGTEGT